MVKWDIFRADDFEEVLNLEAEQVLAEVTSGKLRAHDCVRQSGNREWQRLDATPQFWSAAPPSPPAPKISLSDLPVSDGFSPIGDEHEDDAPDKTMRIDNTGLANLARMEGLGVAITKKTQDPPTVAEPLDPLGGDGSRVSREKRSESKEAPRAGHGAPKLATASKPKHDEHRARTKVDPRKSHKAKTSHSSHSHDDHDEDDAPPKRHREVEEFDLTPMVDMTFLLNMFFMLTTSYALLRSVEIPPPVPKADKTSVKQALSLEDLKEDNIIININADNTITLDEEPIALENLVQKLQETVRNTGRNELVVQSDDTAHMQTLVTVLDNASEAGIQKTKIASAEGPSEAPPPP